MCKIIFFASGSGSNIENIVNYFASNKNVEFLHIYCNRQDAFVFKRAEKLNIKISLINKDDLFNSENLLNDLKLYNPDLIVLAGFLLKMPENIIKLFPNKIINIHPALLPKFGGKGMYGDNVHKAVKEAKEIKTGITIHYVNEYYDEGKIIYQAEVNVSENDSYIDIANKVHELEYKYFPIIIEKLINK